MKKKLTTGFISVLLLSGSLALPARSVSAKTLQEMQEEKNELQQQSGQLNGEIQTRETNMSELQGEKKQLENEVVQIQMSVNQLEDEIAVQTENLKKLEAEIARLQEEIERLKEQIAQREEKLENQARAVQTQGNTTNMVNIIIASENLSDLVGRLGVVTHLLSANKEIVTAQVEDQMALEVNEKQVEEDKQAAENVKTELEVNQKELVAQKQELDNSIMKVAELYQMNAAEKQNFVKEQQLVAQKTAAVNQEINLEQRRIAEEKARQEAARKAAEKKAREEAARKEAARKAAVQKANEERAREEAARKAAADKAKEEEAKREEASAGNSQPAVSKPSVSKPTPAPSKPAPVPSAPKVYPSGMIRPVNGGYLTSRFGYRKHPIFGTQRLHAGIDIGGGGSIMAAKGGTVIHAGWSNGLGYNVKISHGGGMTTVYGHMLPNLLVSMGQSVSQGQKLGTMGSTGNSTGIHLHFEVRLGGRPVDSAPYVGF